MFYGDFDSFDIHDDFDESDWEDFYDDDDGDDYWENLDQEEEEEMLSLNAVAATIIFPVGEEDDIEEIEKKADEWVEFSEEVFNKEDLVNANSEADAYTYSAAETEQNYFCYWQ